MTVNSYLTNLASNAIIRDSEKLSIQRSIATIQNRLNSHFQAEVGNHFQFGSYTRGTILPRSMDERSDIDYMIVFNDSKYRPQTYLDKLKRFVNTYYTSSEISQSNPTIVLSLNHIKFELVPSIYSWMSGLQIPAKASSYDNWISTNPNDFNQTLSNSNTANNNLIKPLIRLVKYWNAKNDYVFESFELEKNIANTSFFGVGSIFSSAQLKDYFFHYMETMNCGFLPPQWKQDAINRAKQLAKETKYYHERGMETLAEKKIQRLLPPTSVFSSIGRAG